MSQDSQYQGSQALNQGLSFKESINTNTGTFSLTKPLVNLMGAARSIGLKLSLVYMPGIKGTLGLPDNWGFSLPYVIPGKSFTTAGGKTSIIDLDWADNKGYKSGLKYINDHGVKFEVLTSPQPLPVGKGTYSFKYRSANGDCSYFDATGKLVQHADLFGNTISYFYSNQQVGVFNNFIDHIVDSFGQTVSFGKEGNQIVASLPNESKITIAYSSEGVANIVDTLGQKTTIQYEQNSDLYVVNTISDPSGLQTRIKHTTIPYKSNSGTGTKPAVRELVHIEGQEPNIKILDHIVYAYGTASGGSTYTGANDGYVLSETSDGLMDSNDEAYLYDVLVSRLDENGKLIVATRNFYNYLHCPTKVLTYEVKGGQVTSELFQTVYSYTQTSDWHARTVNYSRPICTEHLVFSENSKSFIQLRKAVTNYDDFGNPLNSEEYCFDRKTARYVKQSSSVNTYHLTKWGGEMPATATHLDEITGYQTGTDFSLSDDQKTIKTATTKYRPSASAEWVPWKTKETEFNKGRLIQVTLSWSKGSTPDPRSVKSSTQKCDYSYDSTNHLFKITNTNPLGKVSTEEYDVRIPGGPLVKSTNPLGKISSFQYDLLGREVEATDPLGHSIKTTYHVLSKDGFNGATVTGPNNYQRRNYTDAMGRSVRVMDNGDPTKTGSPKIDRILGESSYNTFGKIATQTDPFGGTTTYSYDFIGRLVSRTDSLGNVSETDIDDESLTSTSNMNGILRKRTEKDSLGRPIIITELADPSDPNITYSKLNKIQYNGFGQKTEVTFSSVDLKSQKETNISSVSYHYDRDGHIIKESRIGYLEAEVSSEKDITLDLLCHSITNQKTVSYQGGKTYVVSAEVRSLNAAGQLTSLTNQKNDKEVYAYYDDGSLYKKTRYDGTQFTYTYSDNGLLLSMSWEKKSISYTYYETRAVKTITKDDETISYDYFLDGSAKLISYPNKLSRSFKPDSHSRTKDIIDVAGEVTTHTYHSNGQLNTITHGGDTLTMSYGTLNNTKQLVTGDCISGEKTFSRTLSLDGFGRIIGESSQDSNKNNILSSLYELDSLGRLKNLSVSSALNLDSSTNYTKAYNYDGLNQLIKSSLTPKGSSAPKETTIYSYDGNYNTLTKSVNGKVISFEYNELNQLQREGMVFDKNGRMRTDGEGNTYHYDQLDKLLEVTASNKIVDYTYRPDGSLASLQNTGVSTQNFFYDSTGTVSAVQTSSGKNAQTSWTTFLEGEGSRVAAYQGENKKLYYHVSNSSTALVQADDQYTSLEYNDFGLQTSDTVLPENEGFTWNQEFSANAGKLIYLRSRFYNPALGQFMTMDNRPVDNKYAYCRGNPINGLDPSGHFDWGLFAGIIVGIAATALTGGAAGAAAAGIFGTECAAASVAAATVAGASGAIAGDATTAGIDHQGFSGHRALLDLATGAAGGFVGAGVGGYAGRLAMRSALEAGLSQAEITSRGLWVSGLAGGISGSLASSGVSSAMTGTPFFNKNMGLSLAVGAAAGLGGGFLASGSYLGKLNPKIIPVPISDREIELITPAIQPPHIELENKLLVMAPQQEALGSMSGFKRIINVDGTDVPDYNSALTLYYHEGSPTYDTIAAHGAGNTIFASVDYSGTLSGAPDTVRPITGERFARYLQDEGWAGAGKPPVKLMSCFGAFRNARTIANALQRSVYAGYPEIDRYSFTNWSIFHPS